MKLKSIICATLILMLANSFAIAADPKPQQPAKRDKCPVCGMFVYKYPDWVGQIIFKDGAVFFFDGAKDLFKYYFDIGKYNPDRTADDITAIFVTEYYDMDLIDGRKAHYVVGSEVYGPMGRELIPCKTREDAEQFKKDHGGTLILTFGQVKPSVIKKLD